MSRLKTAASNVLPPMYPGCELSLSDPGTVAPSARPDVKIVPELMPKGPSLNVPEATEAPVYEADRRVIPEPGIMALPNVLASELVTIVNPTPSDSRIAEATRRLSRNLMLKILPKATLIPRAGVQSRQVRVSHLINRPADAHRPTYSITLLHLTNAF